MLLNISIIVLILIGLIVHRHLTAFWEQDLLPYPFGFLLFANSFAVIYLVSFIWMFGIVGGIIVALLCYLQVVYTAGLWVFLLPGLIRTQKSLANFTIPEVKPLVYGGFTFLVIIVAILNVINFYASPYESMRELMGENVFSYAGIFVVILVIGNIARLTVMPIFMGKNKKWVKICRLVLSCLLCVCFIYVCLIGIVMMLNDIHSSKLKSIEKQTVTIQEQSKEELNDFVAGKKDTSVDTKPTSSDTDYVIFSIINNMSFVNKLTVKGVTTVLGYILLFNLFTTPLYNWGLLGEDWKVKSLIKCYGKVLIWHTLIVPGIAIFILGMGDFANYTAKLLENAGLSYLTYPLHMMILGGLVALVIWVYLVLSAKRKKRNKHGKNK